MSNYSNLEVAIYQRKGLPSLRNRIVDMSEPQCMACGKNWDGKYDLNKLDVKCDTVDKALENVPLKQTRILDFGFDFEHKSGKGKNEALDNLILLCDECAQNKPDVDNVSEFIEWANGRGCMLGRSYNLDAFSSTKNTVSVTKEERLLLKVVREFNVDIEVFLLLLSKSELLTSVQKEQLLIKVLRPSEVVFVR